MTQGFVNNSGIALPVSVANGGTGSATGSVVALNGTSIGTTTNNNAAAGIIGEFTTSVIIEASAVTMVSGTPTDLTSISLTAGDWSVWGSIMYATLGTTPTKIIGWVSSSSATLPDSSIQTIQYCAGAPSFVSVSIPVQRFSLAGTTTIYISGKLVNTSGNGTGCGFISARRTR